MSLKFYWFDTNQNITSVGWLWVIMLLRYINFTRHLRSMYILSPGLKQSFIDQLIWCYGEQDFHKLSTCMLRIPKIPVAGSCHNICHENINLSNKVDVAITYNNNNNISCVHKFDSSSTIHFTHDHLKITD